MLVSRSLAQLPYVAQAVDNRFLDAVLIVVRIGAREDADGAAALDQVDLDLDAIADGGVEPHAIFGSVELDQIFVADGHRRRHPYCKALGFDLQRIALAPRG